jgi:NTP pyrophosphatase (non-canonical NTP hydrolase)
MELKELQERMLKFDKARGWDRLLPIHTAAHMAEEVGEIVRHVFSFDEYKGPVKDQKDTLGTELADLIMKACTLANNRGIDLTAAIEKKLSYKETHYDLQAGKELTRRHIDALKRMIADIEKNIG